MLKLSKTERNNLITILVFQTCLVSFLILAKAYISVLYLGSFPQSMLGYYYLISPIAIMLSGAALIPFIKTTSKITIAMILLATIIIIFLFEIFHLTHWKIFTFIFVFFLVSSIRIISAIIWNIGTAAFDIRKFRELSHWMIVCQNFGSFFIGLFVYWLLHKYSYNLIVYFLILLLTVATIVLIPIQLLPAQLPKPQQSLSPLKYKLFIFLIIAISLASMTNIFADYFLKFSMSVNFSKNEIARYTTIIYAACELLSTIVPLFSNYILRRAGLSGMFNIGPFVILLLSIPFIFYPNLIMASIFFIFFSIYYNSYLPQVQQIVLNLLPDAIVAKGNYYIKLLGNRLSGIFAGILFVLLANHFHFLPYQIILMITAVVMLYLSFKLKQNYVTTLNQTIDQKRFYIPMGVDEFDVAAGLKSIPILLNSTDPENKLLAFLLIKNLNPSKMPHEVYDKISDENAQVRLAAIKAIKHYKDEKGFSLLAKNLQNEKDDDNIFEIINSLIIYAPADLKLLLKDLKKRPQAVYKTSVILIMLTLGTLRQVHSALDQLMQFIQSNVAVHRIWIARILAKINIGRPRWEIKQLLLDQDKQVVLAAIDAAGKVKDYNLVNYLFKRLDEKYYYKAVLNALLKFDRRMVHHIVKEIKREDDHHTIPLIRILFNIRTASVNNAIIDLLKFSFKTYRNQTELLKQIAIHACHFPISAEIKKIVLNIIDKKLIELNYLYMLNHHTVSDFFRGETNLLINLRKREFCYLTAISTSANMILQITPLLVLKSYKQILSPEQAKAIELFDLETRGHKYHDKLMQYFSDTVVIKNTLDLPTLLKRINNSWLNNVFKHEQNLHEASTMEPIETVKILRKVLIFKDLPVSILLSLTEDFNYLPIVANQVLYRENDNGQAIYIVVKGKVNLQKGSRIIAVIHEYESFGTLAILDKLSRPLDAIAAEDGLLLVLQRDTFEQLMDDYPDIMRSIINVMINQYKTMIDQIEF